MKSRFRCVKCGFAGHADVVAGVNIRDNLLNSRLRAAGASGGATGGQAAVNQPPTGYASDPSGLKHIPVERCAPADASHRPSAGGS
jgi:transposase